ncbi:MAG: hypothetical protein V5A24_04550 [Haloarculaceae archaeon]
MEAYAREAALDRVAAILETVEGEVMPVPVREVWVYGDVALGLDPIERLDVYVTKDLLFHGEASRSAEFEAEYGVAGVGQSVRAEWADRHPEYLRANSNGYAAPEKCLAAHLLPDTEPVHLEVCNTGFEDNVVQRLQGARARDAYEEIIDPRGVCLWLGDGSNDVGSRDAASSDGRSVDPEESPDGESSATAGAAGGRRSEDALRKLRAGELVFPTLPEALEMLGLDETAAETAAESLRSQRKSQDGTSVRGDVV